MSAKPAGDEKGICASERIVADVLSRAARRASKSGVGIPEMVTPDAAAMAADLTPEQTIAQWGLEDDSVVFFEKMEAVQSFVDFCLADGPDPRRVVLRLFHFIFATRPEKLLNMSARQLSQLFGESHGAWGPREKVIITRIQRIAGYRVTETHLPHHKSETSKKKMAKAAKGNKHRAQSVAA